MKRLFGTVYLLFLVWLLLFPPWAERPYNYAGGPDPAAISLGHHWRFSIPVQWQKVNATTSDPHSESYWSTQPPSSYQWVPDTNAVVDYRLMIYEAVLTIVLLALVYALRPTILTVIRGLRMREPATAAPTAP